jgi:GntR family transcriptional regulator
MRQTTTLTQPQQEKLRSLLQAPKTLDIPKHAYLFQRLKLAIQSGVLERGARFPAEQELVDLAPFSLGTIQRAVQSLVNVKLVTRHHRLGTYVCEDREEISQPWHFRFLNETGDRNLPVFPEVVLRKKITAAGPWATWLPAADGTWTRVDRLINVNDEFLAYSKLYVRTHQFPTLLTLPLKSLHKMNFRIFIEETAHLRVRKINHLVSVKECDKDLQATLNIERRTMCSIFEIFTTGDDGQSLYYQELTLPPNNRKLFLRSDLE